MQSLLIDTNILLLLLVGTMDRKFIRSHRRTAVFTPEDFDLLQEKLRLYSSIVTTPSVMTEVSNLLGNDFHEVAAEFLVSLCTPFVEVIRGKEIVLAQEGFARLGYADASIIAALAEGTVLLTDDLALYLQVLYLGSEAINFNHLRRIDN
jgi:hypothetical protein